MARKRTSKIWLAEKDVFAEIVKNSITITEVLMHFGLQNKGNNYRTFKKRIEEDGLDISHFNSDAVRNKKLENMILGKRIKTEDMLTENSIYQNSTIKKRIINEKLIPYECRDCGINGEWNGKPLSLQLEHVSGNNRDNRLENLCFLCPNCHSQTDTFAGKTNRITYKCVDCLGKVSRHSETGLCRSCGQTKAEGKRKVINRPSIEVLLEEISKLGYKGTGQKYGVSDNAVRKWVKIT